MLKYKVNVNEYSKITSNSIKLRKNLKLNNVSNKKQKINPLVNGLSVILSTIDMHNGDSFMLNNLSESFELIVIDDKNNIILRLEPLDVVYLMYDGSAWVKTSEFFQYLHLPIQLTQDLDPQLGYDSYVENTIGQIEIDKKIPPSVDVDKIRFNSYYPEIKIILYFAKHDTNGNYIGHSNVFDDKLFEVNSNYFKTSYLQLNYYSDNLVQANSLIDFKKYKFSNLWLGDVENEQQTAMLVQKPNNHPYNLNIENYFFYYFRDLFDVSPNINLFFNGEFKNTKTGKSKLFTTEPTGIITNGDGSVNPNKLYTTMELKYSNEKPPQYKIDSIGTDNRLHLYEVINKR